MGARVDGMQIVVAVMARRERPAVPADLFALPGGAFDGMEQYLDLMRQCWSGDPEARPSFTNIIKCLRHLSEDCRPAIHPPHASISPHGPASQPIGLFTDAASLILTSSFKRSGKEMTDAVERILFIKKMHVACLYVTPAPESPVRRMALPWESRCRPICEYLC